MSQFRPLADHELDRLADEALIAHVRDARDAGAHDHARHALRVLVFGHWDNVVRRVAMKVPGADVEDVAGEVIVSAVRSAFDGESAGEFREWLRTITARRVADYHRTREGHAPLGSLDAGPAAGDPGAIDVPVASHEGYVAVQDAIGRVLGDLSDAHREIVRLAVFEDLPAIEVAARVPGMSPANVDKIKQRFRDELRRRLEDDGDTSA